MVTVFAKVDALPSAELRPAFVYGNGNGTAEHGRFYMSRHVIRAFHCVNVWEILRSDRAERALEIDSDIRVGVFVNRKRSRSVLNEYV